MTATTPEPPAAGTRRGGYLPVLPDGWDYTITMVRRTDLSDTSIRIQPEVKDDEPTGRSHVFIYSAAGRKNLMRDSLSEAIRSAVAAAKALERLAETEAALAEARRAAFDSIGGGDDEDGDEVAPGQIGDPVAAGDLATHAETDDEREAANGNGIEDEDEE